MFVNQDQFRPSDQDLADCECIYADGDKHNAKHMRDWARDNCTSLMWWEAYDMSDISSWVGPDNCVVFYVLLPIDATAFRLRWL